MIGVQDASAAWVNKVYEAAQFFTDLGSATDGWGFSGADFDSPLFQLFPEGDAHDNRPAALKLAKAIGGKWTLGNDNAGITWETEVTFRSGAKAKIILHYVLRNAGMPAELVNLAEIPTP